MRKNMKKIKKLSSKFNGTFVRYGSGINNSELNTILLKNITDSNGVFLTDHTWLCVKKRLLYCNFKKNDKIVFKGTVCKYKKRDLAGLTRFKHKDLYDYHFANLREIKKNEILETING